MITTAADLDRFRAEALGRMTSTATIRRRSSTTATVNGFVADVWGTVATMVPFRLGGSRGAGTATRQVVGDVSVTAATRVGHFPYDFTDLADGDLVEIIGGDTAGKVFKIVETTWQDQATARRVQLVEAQRPTEWP